MAFILLLARCNFKEEKVEPILVLYQCLKHVVQSYIESATTLSNSKKICIIKNIAHTLALVILNEYIRIPN